MSERENTKQYYMVTTGNAFVLVNNTTGDFKCDDGLHYFWKYMRCEVGFGLVVDLVLGKEIPLNDGLLFPRILPEPTLITNREKVSRFTLNLPLSEIPLDCVMNYTIISELGQYKWEFSIKKCYNELKLDNFRITINHATQKKAFYDVFFAFSNKKRKTLE